MPDRTHPPISEKPDARDGWRRWSLPSSASDGPASPRRSPIRSRTITMIVPFPAGGATDTLARYLAEQMRGISRAIRSSSRTSAGAAGSIGVGRAVRSPADGYTLSIGTSTTHMLTGGLYALPFDLLKDLEPVIYIGSEPLLIAAPEEPAGGRSQGIDRVSEGQSRQGVGRDRRRRRRQAISPESRFRRRPRRSFSSCPIAAMRRRCRICWRDRSIS